MTTVFCTWNDCENNKEGICQLTEMHHGKMKGIPTNIDGCQDYKFGKENFQKSLREDLKVAHDKIQAKERSIEKLRVLELPQK